MNAVDETLAPLRQTMVDCQLRTFDVTDHAVLGRMAAVPREIFLAEGQRPLSYSDRAVEVTAGNARRRLLAPMVLGRMLQGAIIDADDNILCVGGGTGYGAAVAAGLGKSVVALELETAFADAANTAFAALGLGNARAVSGAMDRGWPSAAPFDVIVVEGAIETKPSALLDLLADNGRLVAIETLPGAAQSGAGRAVRYERIGGIFGSQPLFSCIASVLPCFEAKADFTF
jgi:protein-L-isoaspartate(D-aspartate) O-methyltransferase